MDRAEYLNAVNEFIYQGEVFGEAILNGHPLYATVDERLNREKLPSYPRLPRSLDAEGDTK